MDLSSDKAILAQTSFCISVSIYIKRFGHSERPIIGNQENNQKHHEPGPILKAKWGLKDSTLD